jgi:tetratricopeptide (TPR) repeat protein
MSNMTKDAEKVINELSEENPDSATVTYLKGYNLYMNGALKESQVMFAQALGKDFSLEKARVVGLKAQRLNELMDETSKLMNIDKNYQAAVDTLTSALDVDDTNIKINQAIYFQRALAFFHLGNSEKSLGDYAKFDELKKVNGSVIDELKMMKVEQ